MAIISYINNFSCYSSEGQLSIPSDYVNHKKWTYKNDLKNYEFKKGVGIDHCKKGKETRQKSCTCQQ